MASVGEAAARGLESGFGLGMRARNQQLDEEARARRIKQEDEDRAFTLDERTRKRQREEEDSALKALDTEYEDLRMQRESFAKQYGKDVPPEIAGPHSERVSQITGARNTIIRKRYEPLVKERQQKLADLSSRLQSGQIDIKDVPDTDFYQGLLTAARRDPADLLSVEGKPSRVAQAGTDVITGMETGNEQMLLAGANVLLEPELKIGIGGSSPHGGKVVGKEIIKMIPDPRDPKKFMPVVRVYVKKDGKQAGPNMENGATGYYDAPITENRTSDPSDTVKSIDIQEAMDYVGRMQTLSTMLDEPSVRAKIERARAESKNKPDLFLEAFYAVRDKAGKDVDWKTLNPGQRLVGINKTTGQQVGTVEGPAKAAPAAGLAGQIDAIQQFADENGISFDEASKQLRKGGLLRGFNKYEGGGAPAGGGGSGGGLATPGKGLTGKALLDSLNEDDAITVEGLANGSIKPAEISQKGNRREKMLALAKRFDPTADWGASGKLKDTPAPAQKAMLENNTNMERAMRALRLVGGGNANNAPREGESIDESATGLKGYLPNQLLNRMDEKGVEARAAIAELGSLIIHDRSGAAVTAAEFPRLAPFIPTEKDEPATVRKKLNSFVRIYREEMAALQSTYGPDNGYKEFKVGGKQGTAATRATEAEEGKGKPAAAPAVVKTATNPKTGERLILKDGKWQPMQ
jgi:hypothetical protein